MVQDTLEQEKTNEFENANELRERFSQLEEEKRNKLQDQENSTDDTESDSMAIRGIVDNMEEEEHSIGKDKVNVKVDYFLDSEEKSKEFTLDMPSSEDQFSTDNRFVRMVNFFGDRKNDPTGLLKREVWLKIQGDDISLHIPDSLSRTSTTKEKLKRKRISRGIGDWEDGVVDNDYKDGAFSVTSAIIGIFGFVSLSSATSIPFTLGTGFLAVALIAVVLLIALAAFSIFDPLFHTLENKKVKNSIVATTLLFSVIACFSGYLGLIQYTVPPQDGAFTTTISNAIPLVGSTILLSASALMCRKPAKRGASWVRNKVDSVKTWYQKQKGIEHVDVNQ